MFQCSQCGLCCQHIDLVPELAKFHNGNGICIHLKDNICSIYTTRPDICRVDVMYEKEYSKYYSLDEFYKINEEVCKQLKKNHQKKD